MAEYIERESLIKDFQSCGASSNLIDAIVYRIKLHKIADVEPVKHGHWEWFEEWLPSTPDHPAECEDCGWRCSECKTALEDIVGGYWDDIDIEPMINYCPNCGTKMDMEE